MTDEIVVGITVLAGGRTNVPSDAMELLRLRYTPRRRQKLLWIQEEGEIVVKKGTLQSSFRKTMLSRGGKTAIPKHIRQVLKLKLTHGGEERLIWIRRGDDVIVRRDDLV